MFLVTGLLGKKHEDIPFEGKAQVVLEHLVALAAVVKQLAEGSWLAVAAGAVESAQKLAIANCAEGAEGATEKA